MAKILVTLFSGVSSSSGSLTIEPTWARISRGVRASVQTHHLVDGLDDLQHLVVADLAVAVDVVQLEGPVQLVFHLASRRHRQRADELLEVDRARLVLVEDAEDIVGELGRVAKGEELLVDLLELFAREIARRTVLEKA